MHLCVMYVLALVFRWAQLPMDSRSLHDEETAGGGGGAWSVFHLCCLTPSL